MHRFIIYLGLLLSVGSALRSDGYRSSSNNTKAAATKTSPACGMMDNYQCSIPDDIGNFGAMYQDGQCCSKCLQTENCRAYTWNKGGDYNCWLKYSCKGKKYKSGYVSGNIAASPTSTASPSTSTCSQSCTWIWTGSSSCKDRTQYEMTQGLSLCAALSVVNAECDGQCSCSAVEDFGGTSPCTTTTTTIANPVTTANPAGCSYFFTDDYDYAEFTIHGVREGCSLFPAGCFGDSGQFITTPDPIIRYNAPCTSPTGCPGENFSGVNTPGWIVLSPDLVGGYITDSTQGSTCIATGEEGYKVTCVGSVFDDPNCKGSWS